MAVLTDYIITKRNGFMQPSAPTKAPVIAVILRRQACSAILFRLSSIALGAESIIRRPLPSPAGASERSVRARGILCAVRTCRCVGMSLHSIILREPQRCGLRAGRQSCLGVVLRPAVCIIALMPERRFPAPWTVEEYRGISYIVRDANNFPVAYVYFESEPGRRAAANLMTKDEARKIAAGIAKLPELLKRARD